MASLAVVKRKKASKKPKPKPLKGEELPTPLKDTPPPPSTSVFSTARAPSHNSAPLQLSFPSLNSSQFDVSLTKRKLAPRSSLQFKIGPHFTLTHVSVPIFDSKDQCVQPVICPRIDRGFEFIDGDWIGYKRNYFTLVSSFYFDDIGFEKFAGDEYHIIDQQRDDLVRIKYFAIKLVSRCAEEDPTTHINLIQHTAKRDRGPQFPPPIHPVIPSELPDHDIIREAANVRNIGKIQKMDSIFYFDKKYNDDYKLNISGLRDYPNEKIFKVARYERVQFSSSINYKKPSLNNKRFKLSVELVGFTEYDEFVKLAYTETPPLIVRGRSPSNYIQDTPDGSAKGSKAMKSIKKPQVKIKLPDDSEIVNNETIMDNFEIDNIDLDLRNLLGFKESNTDTVQLQGGILNDLTGFGDEAKKDLLTVDFSNFPLDDVETFNILSLANKELDTQLQTSNMKTKKKQGRKPKLKTCQRADTRIITEGASGGIEVNGEALVKKQKKKGNKRTKTKIPTSSLKGSESQDTRPKDLDPLQRTPNLNILHEITNTYINVAEFKPTKHLTFETMNYNNMSFKDKEPKDIFERHMNNSSDVLENDLEAYSLSSTAGMVQSFGKHNILSPLAPRGIFTTNRSTNEENISNLFTTAEISDVIHDNELFLMKSRNDTLKLIHPDSLPSFEQFQTNPSELMGTYDDEAGFFS